MDITLLKNDRTINQIRMSARDTDCKVYLIGGVLRDIILNNDLSDYDFLVFGNIDLLTAELEKRLDRPRIIIGGADKEVIRFVKEGVTYDFTRAKAETIEDDVHLRDFTINTLAYSLEDDEVIDIIGAIDDIKAGIIRIPSDTSFDDDPLRMLRAFRFMATLRFKIDDKTLPLIKQKKDLIKKIAGERIREELFKILSEENSYDTILKMADSGILYSIFPELTDSIDCAQNDYHHLDVMEHTLIAYKHFEEIMADLGKYFPKVIRELREYLIEKPLIAKLKYALLLHDVAKPATKSSGDDGRIHFYRHAELGEEMAKKINDRLRLSNSDSAFICAVIRQHLRIVPFFKMMDEGTLNDKSIIRYFMRTSSVGLFVILHNLADLMASRGIKRASEDEIKKVIDLSNTMLDVYFNEYLMRKRNPPLITGKDLISEFGLTPSPIFSVILDSVYAKQMSGEITTKEEAREMVKGLIHTQIVGSS
ncbi:CCA tRNA nucleotidyltransferase [Thermodesulfobacteriota bacterium]